MTVAKVDIETFKCIVGISNWEFCDRLKKLRGELAQVELAIEKLIEDVR